MISKCETVEGHTRAHTHRYTRVHIAYGTLGTLEDSPEVGKTGTRRKGAKEMSQVFDC